MSDQVTIAELLSRVFAGLHPNINGRGEPLFHGWRAVLGGQSMTELDVLENLGLISASITRLKAQITESKRLTASTKRSAMQTVDEFGPLLQLASFNQPGNHFASRCAEKPCGDLAMIGHGLEREFSEPALQKADADVIAESLREVQKLLAESKLPVDLRVNLEKHLKAMLWWLAHPEIASAQDLFESMGSAMIIAEQLTERAESSSEEIKAAATGIKKFVNKAGSVLAGIVRFGAQNPDKVETLIHATGEGIKLLGGTS